MSTASRLPYLAVSAASGLLFGAGLYISQMVDPHKVLRFLDFGAIPSGGWDPSLAFVIVPVVSNFRSEAPLAWVIVPLPAALALPITIVPVLSAVMPSSRNSAPSML